MSIPASQLAPLPRFLLTLPTSTTHMLETLLLSPIHVQLISLQPLPSNPSFLQRTVHLTAPGVDKRPIVYAISTWDKKSYEQVMGGKREGEAIGKVLQQQKQMRRIKQFGERQLERYGACLFKEYELYFAEHMVKVEEYFILDSKLSSYL